MLIDNLWGEAGPLAGTHAGGRWGPVARRRRRFFRDFFHGSSAYLRPCTLLAQCASPRIGCWHSRGYAYTASRAWAVKRDHAPSQDSAGASLLDRQTWWSRVTNVGPVRHRAIDSSELRLTTDREGRQVGQHRSHIVAAVSSAWLIARAAASGSQGRIVSSLSPGRPRADVGLSAVWSDLSAVSTTDQVGVF